MIFKVERETTDDKKSIRNKRYKNIKLFVQSSYLSAHSLSCLKIFLGLRYTYVSHNVSSLKKFLDIFENLTLFVLVGDNIVLFTVFQSRIFHRSTANHREKKSDIVISTGRRISSGNCVVGASK